MSSQLPDLDPRLDATFNVPTPGQVDEICDPANNEQFLENCFETNARSVMAVSLKSRRVRNQTRQKPVPESRESGGFEVALFVPETPTDPSSQATVRCVGHIDRA